MRVYLIRHAETSFNKRKVHQDADARLTPQGIEQANKLTERVRREFSVDLIIESDMIRSQQTAEVLANGTGASRVTCELFREVRRPSSVLGRSYYHPASLYAMLRIVAHAKDPNFRYLDEENGCDVLLRARKAQKFIEEQSPRNIAVVTHRTFLKVLVEVMLYGTDNLAPHALFGARHPRAHENTGITELESFEEKEEEGKIAWRLLRWNDHQHIK